MIPTVGFNMRKVTRGGVVIKLWDLGGQVGAGQGNSIVILVGCNQLTCKLWDLGGQVGALGALVW